MNDGGQEEIFQEEYYRVGAVWFLLSCGWRGEAVVQGTAPEEAESAFCTAGQEPSVAEFY